MRELLLSNPLPIAVIAVVAILVIILGWKIVKGVGRVLLILVLLAAIAVALFWLKGMGPIGR
jgi:purine-cytosine permease-like protein